MTEVLPESFADCTQLKEITVNGGIALRDGCFAKCKTLKKILLNAEPQEIVIGTGLLEGTDAFLYAEDRDAYALDYSWGIYAEKIKKLERKG